MEYAVPVAHEGSLPLHLAVAAGASLEAVQVLLQHHEGAAGISDGKGQLPLHLAVRAQADPAVVTALLQENKSAASQSDGKYLPLHCALEFHAPSRSIEEILNAYPAAAEIPGNDGKQRLPLHLAVLHQADDHVIVALLTQHSDAASQPDSDGLLPLHHAAGNCATIAVVETIYQANEKAIECPDSQGLLPLHHAAKGHASLEVVELLLRKFPAAVRHKGSIVELEPNDGDTSHPGASGGERLPLHWAVCSAGKVRAVAALMKDYPEAADEKDQDGNLPIHCACQSQASEDVVGLLLKHSGASANTKNCGGELPLHLAAGWNAPVAVVRDLIGRYGDAAKEPDLQGRLPIHHAARGSATKTVLQLLLEAHKDGAHVKDEEGFLPLHLAAELRSASEGAVQRLMDYNPQAVMTKDPDENLPLHIAAHSNAPPTTVRLLLGAYRSAASQKNKNGDLPLHLAARESAAPEVIQLLLEANEAAAAEPGWFGELPLHMTQDEPETKPDAIGMLVAAYPLALAEEDQYGRLPLEWSLSKAPAAVVNSVAHLEYSSASALVWHGIVSEEACAKLIGEAVRTRPELAKWPDEASGRSAFDAACVACREAIRNALYFVCRYEIVREVHRSATCIVYLAQDSKRDGERVALKLMHDASCFLAEVNMREKYSLSPESIVGWILVHVDPDADKGAAELMMCSLREQLGKRFQTGQSFGKPAIVGHDNVLYGCRGDFAWDALAGLAFECMRLRHALEESSANTMHVLRYCLVMDQAEKNLGSALVHGRFASLDWQMVRKIGADLLKALSHMHCRGLVHCDLKPLNIMEAEHRWKLIDLDTSCVLGHSFGRKAPSSGYAPPEMARAMLEAGYGRPGSGDPSLLGEYRAGVAHDLWGLGAVLYYMACAYPPWQMTTDDNVDLEDLNNLACWDQGARNRKLVRGGVVESHPIMCDLLAKLLEPDPEVRAGHWEAGMECEAVLQHDFFKEKRAVDDFLAGKMEEILETVQQQRDLVQHQVIPKMERLEAGQQSLADKLDQSLQLLQAQKAMMKEIIKGVNDLPSCAIFLPDERTENGMQLWIEKLKQPKETVQGLFTRRIKLHFVCDITFEIDSVGFPIEVTREWLRKAGPYLKVGLTVLKVAAAVGRLFGYPVPDLAGCSGQAIGWMSDTVNSALGEEAAAVFDQAAENAGRLFADSSSVALESEPPRVPLQTHKIMRRSAQELREKLPTDWEQCIGLAKAVVPEGQGKSSGATVWCMRELEEIVEEHGLSEDIDYLALLHSRMRENARRASATRGNPVELHEDEAELLPGGVPMQQQGPSAPGSSGSCPPGRRNNKLHPSSQSISQTSSTIPAQWESRRSLCGVM